MDAIKPGFRSDSQPINLIRDAPNRGEIAHTAGKQVKYLPRGVGARCVTVCQPLPPAVLQTGVRTRTPSVRNRLARVKKNKKNIAPVQFALEVTAPSPHLVVRGEKHGTTNLSGSMKGSIKESINVHSSYYGAGIPTHKKHI